MLELADKFSNAFERGAERFDVGSEPVEFQRERLRGRRIAEEAEAQLSVMNREDAEFRGLKEDLNEFQAQDFHRSGISANIETKAKQRAVDVDRNNVIVGLVVLFEREMNRLRFVVIAPRLLNEKELSAACRRAANTYFNEVAPFR